MEAAGLYSKMEALPDKVKSEVNDFIDFLIARKKTVR